MKEEQATAFVPLTETTAELIPQPTAELIEKSFAEMAESLLNSHYVRDTIGYQRGKLGSNRDSYRHRRGQHVPG